MAFPLQQIHNLVTKHHNCVIFLCDSYKTTSCKQLGFYARKKISKCLYICTVEQKG